MCRVRDPTYYFASRYAPCKEESKATNVFGDALTCHFRPRLPHSRAGCGGNPERRSVSDVAIHVSLRRDQPDSAPAGHLFFCFAKKRQKRTGTPWKGKPITDSAISADPGLPAGMSGAFTPAVSTPASRYPADTACHRNESCPPCHRHASARSARCLQDRPRTSRGLRMSRAVHPSNQYRHER